MKLLVKTLKGGKFHVECEPTSTISQVKTIIESSKSELPAANMKLIHSGKVLKDDAKIEACGIKPNDFLVVMVTKAKKVAPKPAPAATPAPATPAPAESESKPAAAATPATSAAATTASAAATPAATTASAGTPAAPSRPADNFSAEIVSNLTGMGFPEAEVRHCLRAANGNPDVAMEFLTNGIPPGVQQPTAATTSRTPSSGGQPLQALRDHPQFDDLRRLVQSNPALLQSVLTQIGQQQPELLEEINSNQAAFLELMNTPVESSSSSTTRSSATSSSGGASSSSSSAPRSGGMPSNMLEGMANPAQMAEMIQSMSPTELNQMAAMMGLSPEQLRTTAQMLGQIPPEQLQQYMMQAMGEGGAEGMAGLMGGMGNLGAGGMGGGLLGGQQVLRLTEDEMAAVNRLTEMGFDRNEAAQAFLACDKNEALAANLLMDSMGSGGFFGGSDPPGSSGSGGNNGGSGGNDDSDDMYD